MKQYEVTATRTYYSTIEFTIKANSRKEAHKKAQQMLNDCKVEFDGIDASDEPDDIEVWCVDDEEEEHEGL